MATAIMKQKEVPEMDDVEEVISKISEESPYKRRLTQKRTWMTVPERYESILSALKNGTPIRLNIIKLPEKNQGNLLRQLKKTVHMSSSTKNHSV